jgi:hypothetical protein
MRLRTFLALLVVAACGLAAKSYSGPGNWWVNNYGPASVAYVVFFMLAAFLIVPRRRAIIPIAVGVLTVTCLLEVLQLWQPPWLRFVRSTFIGASLLGTTYSWWDFPAYGLGAIAGCVLLRRMADGGWPAPAENRMNHSGGPRV